MSRLLSMPAAVLAVFLALPASAATYDFIGAVVNGDPSAHLPEPAPGTPSTMSLYISGTETDPLADPITFEVLASYGADIIVDGGWSASITSPLYDPHLGGSVFVAADRFRLSSYGSYFNPFTNSHTPTALHSVTVFFDAVGSVPTTLGEFLDALNNSSSLTASAVFEQEAGGIQQFNISYTPVPAPIPLPATAALMLAGLAVLAGLRRNRG